MTKINNFYTKLFDLAILNWNRYWGVILTVALLFFAISVIGGLYFHWSWTGFAGEPIPVTAKDIPNSNPPTQAITVYPQGKSFWDLLSLLIVPAALAIGVWWLNRQQRKSEQELAEQQQKQERSIAKDRDEERALQSYLDAMTELLLKENLRASENESDTRTVARSRTLTVLRGLNGTRKASILQFLYEAKLLDKDELVINLLGADLYKANLPGGFLRGAFLHRTNLRKADLRGAFLIEADLSEADLCRTNLRGANMHKARLSGADLRKANLIDVDLCGADLSYANLCGADLRGADLREAFIYKIILEDAKYCSKSYYIEYGEYIIRYSPTQWPDNFDPEAVGAIDVSKQGD